MLHTNAAQAEKLHSMTFQLSSHPCEVSKETNFFELNAYPPPSMTDLKLCGNDILEIVIGLYIYQVATILFLAKSATSSRRP